MVLTAKEKKMLIRILKKEKRRLFSSKESKRNVNQLLDKLEQSSRNEKVNEVKPSKL